MRRISYIVPSALVAAIVLLAQPSWWAVALLTGGVMFLWDWLWGDHRMLQGSYGFKVAGLGCLLIAAGFVLAQGLGLSLAEFHATAKGLHKREATLYQLPAVGIGFLAYGLLIWSRASSRENE